MKRCLIFLMVLLLCLPAARAETTLRVGYYALPEAFEQAHPEVRAELDNSFNEQALQQALMTRDLNMDVFQMNTDYISVPAVIDKGFCLDLSGSEIIRSAVERMYPSVARQIMRDGHIYALPIVLFAGSDQIYRCNEEVWTELGYTLEDVPKTFPALLDFLEAWVDRMVAEDLPYNLIGNWDESAYNAYCYPDWLVDYLMDSYIRQMEASGEPLRFTDPELPGLLDRALRVGTDIFNLCEPVKSAASNGPSLFDNINLYFGGWAETDWMLDTRLRESDPSALSASLSLMAVYAGTQEPELCIELLEKMWLEIEAGPERGDLTVPYLCADAEPVPNAQQQTALRLDRNYIAIAEHRLAGDETDITAYLELEDSDYVLEPYRETTDFENYTRFKEQVWQESDQEVAEKLEGYRQSLAFWQDYVWYLSPEDLAAYRAYVNDFSFQAPSVFQYNTDDWTSYRSLLSQFTHGQISSQQLLQQLDGIARMIQLEQ